MVVALNNLYGLLGSEMRDGSEPGIRKRVDPAKDHLVSLLNQAQAAVSAADKSRDLTVTGKNARKMEVAIKAYADGTKAHNDALASLDKLEASHHGSLNREFLAGPINGTEAARLADDLALRETRETFSAYVRDLPEADGLELQVRAQRLHGNMPVSPAEAILLDLAAQDDVLTIRAIKAASPLWLRKTGIGSGAVSAAIHLITKRRNPQTAGYLEAISDTRARLKSNHSTFRHALAKIAGVAPQTLAGDRD